MSIRLLHTLLSLAAFCLATTLCDGAERAPAKKPKATVTFEVTKASAKRSGKDTHFLFDVRLDNATGKELELQTNFNTVFDGLMLSVTTPKGKKLAEQSYTYHQSPYAPPGNTITLKQGTTNGKLLFPVHEFPSDAGVVKVRLWGGLPGHASRYLLSSKPIKLKIASR